MASHDYKYKGLFVAIAAPLLLGASCSQLWGTDQRYCSCSLEFETANECEFDKFILSGEWVKNEEDTQKEGSLTPP